MVETVRGSIRQLADVVQGQTDGESQVATPRPGLTERIRIAAETEGFEAAEYIIAKHEAHLWSRLSKIAEPTSLKQSLVFAERAFDRSPPDSQVAYARRAARLARDVGGHRPPDRILEALVTSSNPADVTRATRLINDSRVWRELAENGFPIPDRRETPAYPPIPAKILYCLHNSLPHDSGGYATRSHGVLQSVERAGLSIMAYTRLGYPWDTPKQSWKGRELDFPNEDVIDGIVYRRMPTQTAGRRQLPIDRYMKRYADELEAVVLRERPEILHAASAFLVGVPAVAVARRLGIPSVYEVRGLWEVTHVSRNPDWAESEQHDAYIRLETQAALAADAVLTLTNALKHELIRRGVPEEKITVVPNSVDTDRFVALERDTDLARQLGVEGKRIVGYVGSFVDYEGLDDLLHAVALVIDRGTDFRLLLVGDGAELPRLHALVQDLELTDHVIMPGRIPFEAVQRFYSLVDVAAFPRKPWPVTEMVSPMKPFEAMAMEKALLVSSVEALTEIVADGETGVVFEKGSIDSLADSLERMIEDPDLCVRLGKRAREWVVDNRRWDQAAATIHDVYRNIQQSIPLPELVPVDNAESELWERLTTNPRELARQAAVLSYPWDGRILDVGMGHGYVACLIARAHQPDLIVGVDVEMRWAQYARGLARVNGIDNIIVSVGSAEDLPLADGSFDRVIITQVLEHVDRPDNAIREIARVLKPAGSVLIAVPTQGKMPPGTVAGHVQDFSIDEMLRMIRDAGLDVVEHRKVGVREFYFVRPVAKRATAAG